MLKAIHIAYAFLRVLAETLTSKGFQGVLTLHNEQFADIS